MHLCCRLVARRYGCLGRSCSSVALHLGVMRDLGSGRLGLAWGLGMRGGAGLLLNLIALPRPICCRGAWLTMQPAVICILSPVGVTALPDSGRAASGRACKMQHAQDYCNAWLEALLGATTV
jgi:hypothetical protein